MRVKMLISRVGVTETFNAGFEYDLPEERALRWLDSGFSMLADVEAAIVQPLAEVAVAEPVVEAAALSPVVEIATKRGRRK